MEGDVGKYQPLRGENCFPVPKYLHVCLTPKKKIIDMKNEDNRCLNDNLIISNMLIIVKSIKILNVQVTTCSLLSGYLAL